ncbi:MAG: hypothetical protein A3E87_09495 [Gammaproteobacteria bacterium RIFCSPHIGHO2_12_FULL_35_23]|nr:MAG: hypothetical protein A3E87_09495 [Gammaproteobacteria bacterium RIFCSPHIGHO2_12_FULL_35_23]
MYPNQPKGIGGVVGAGWHLYKACFFKILPLAFITAIVGSLTDFLEVTRVIAVPVAGSNQLVILFLSLVITILIMVWLMGTIYSLLSETALGHSTRLLSSLQVASHHYWKLLIVFIITSIITIVGLILVVVPGIVLGVFLIFSLPLVIVDNRGIGGSIGHSLKLVAGSWWHVFMTLLIPIIVIAVLSCVSFFIFGGTLSNLASTPRWSNIISDIIIMTLLSPWLYGTIIMLLNNVKLRKNLKASIIS